MKRLTIYECHSLGDRSPLGMADTLVGAAAFVAAYATSAGWQIAFWGIDRTMRTVPTPSSRKTARPASSAPSQMGYDDEARTNYNQESPSVRGAEQSLWLNDEVLRDWNEGARPNLRADAQYRELSEQRGPWGKVGSDTARALGEALGGSRPRSYIGKPWTRIICATASNGLSSMRS